MENKINELEKDQSEILREERRDNWNIEKP